VTKSFTNAGYETVDEADATQIVYTVKVLKSISQQSFASAVLVVPSTTTSTITVGTPHALSTAPLSGKYRITCPNADGNAFVSR